MSVTIHIDGLAAIQQKLLELPDRVNRKIVRHAVSEGAAIIRDDARSRAPVYAGIVAKGHPAPGTLAKSIWMKYIPERSTPQNCTFYVGVRHGKKYEHYGKKNRNVDAYYFAFVEFGTSKMAARPFLRPAWDSGKDTALYAIKYALQAGIDAEVASL